MKPTRKKWNVLLASLLLLLLPVTASANAAAPPNLTVLVVNAPEDLQMTLTLSESSQSEVDEIEIESRAWETYYRFFLWNSQSSADGELNVTTGGETSTYTIPREALEKFGSCYTLDLKTGELTEGTVWYRSGLLAALRVILTLLIEGLVFFLSGYRKRRSWLVFFIVNLVTQGFLNFELLTLTTTIFSTYMGALLLILCVLEALIFAVEAVAFSFLLKEYTKKRAVFYAFIANVASLGMGGLILSVMPF